ncbi:uncharacterized protein LOC123536425 [Mercenaria mercenaria]|uniref:uncharacterized protein LOC123536425 n=1 Tax=Mercenaria mercenaria TaxID=6596 RepID=UPI00234F5381|nr:uncharacterized protein LOC123536425 [Mercenaria mercenaria]
MFASAGIHVSRGGLFHHAEARRIGLHNFSSSMGTSSQKPFRKGVGFTTVSGLVMISGVIITVLGFMDVFDSGYTMMGMLMIAVAVLLFLGALRMFLVASKLRKAERTLQISRGTVASMVIEREDERGTLTVVMDTVNIEARCRRRQNLDFLHSTSRRRLTSHVPATPTTTLLPAPQEITTHKDNSTISATYRNNSASCQCQSEVKLMKDQLSSMQADILMLKQSLHVSEKLWSDQVKVVSDNVKLIKSDILGIKNTDTDSVSWMKSSLHEIVTCNGALSFNLKCILKRVIDLERFLDGENIHVVQIAMEQNAVQESSSVQSPVQIPFAEHAAALTSSPAHPIMTFTANVTDEKPSVMFACHSNRLRVLQKQRSTI